jgi:trigger factor
VKTSVETLDPVKVKLTVEVEPKRVKQAFDRAARELAKQVNIPGFRPGKAPRRLLEQRFGEGVIAQTAMEDALTDYYVEALEQEEIAAVSQPEVEVETFDEEEGATFTATVEVRPSFEPPDHTGITVGFPDWEVDDDAVEEQLGQLRERFAELEEVERAARTGDYVTIDLTFEIDGEEVEDAAVEDAMYEVGSEGVTPQLDEEIVGKGAGDSFTYVDTLPEGYPEHGGKEATFHVTVKDVRAKTLPELDDDFAATASGFDTLEEFRRDVRASLLRRSIVQAQHELRGRVVEAYLARVEVDLPPSMVEADKQARIGQLEQQAERFGVDVEDLFETEETTREEFESRAEEQARSTVKAQLVIDRLAETLAVEVEPADIDTEIVRHARANDVEPEEIARIIREQGSLPALIGDVLRRKAIDELVAAATVEGGPSDEVLIELGLKQDPDAAAETDEDVDAEGGSRLYVPGQDAPEGGDAGERKLIVPGQD